MSDLRLALRLLWKDKAFSATAALTLALCIGANTALFTVVHNVLLRPLPVPESDRILLMSNSYPKAGASSLGYSGVPDYFDRLRETNVYEEQALMNVRTRVLDQNGTPTRVVAEYVTPSFFRLVRVAPAMGRAFSDSEGELGNDKKVVLSHALWQSQFGGAASAIGSTLRIDGQPYTVVGIMPRDFVFVNQNVLMWLPLAFTPEQKADSSRHSNNWQHIGRLKPGATLQQAQAQIDALNRANLDRFPQYRELLINAGFTTIVTPLQDFVVADVKATLFMMWAGALFVLLIGAVNVANLVLVRSRTRIKELATRLALGAARTRLARQLVTESVVLTMASAAAGIALGMAALRLFGTVYIEQLPRGNEIHIDPIVIVYTLGLAAAIGLALGFIPVASVLPANLTVVLREEGRGSTTGRGARVLRRSLVVAQVAFAFVLLVGAGLLFASLRQVLAVDPGFNANGVFTASVTLPRARYANDDALRRFTDESLRRIRALPGVTAAGATTTIPFGGNHNDSVIIAEGYQMKPGESVISPAKVEVTPGYFEAMGIRLARGRLFTDGDTGDAPKVIIVDEKLAARFWPGRDPIGRRMYFPQDINNLLAITPKTEFMTVVGVIRDVKLDSITEGDKSVGAYYRPMAQDTAAFMTYAIKTPGDPGALATGVRGAIGQLDPEIAVFGTDSMRARVERALITRRSPVLLSLTFGAVALFLSAIGIYGVLAYLVTQRTREIGIRIALGSSASAIFDLVLREGLVLIGSGFLVGAAGALALRRTLQSQLFGVSATDPLVLATVAALLGVVAILACALPARRATRIDPIVALSE